MAESMRQLLEGQARRHGVALSEKQTEQFLSYLQLIQKWQENAVRLVGSAEPAELVGKHVSDAFSVYNCLGRCQGGKLIDIGSGSGFPGLCLKLVEPRLDVTLLEASSRKASFLAKARAELGLRGVRVVRARAEEIAEDDGFREEFDLATVQGVASLPRVIQLGLPFVRIGGSLVVARGRSSRADIETAESIGRSLGAREVIVHSGSVGNAPIRGSIMILVKVTGAGKGFRIGGSRAEGTL